MYKQNYNGFLKAYADYAYILYNVQNNIRLLPSVSFMELAWVVHRVVQMIFNSC
jgi:hypothetical protein